MVKYLHGMAERPTPSDALDRVLLLHSLLSADLARFEREHGLTTARVHLLWQLGTAGPSTQAALAQALAVSPRNVTGLVDGLVASGHVTRQPHPADRRATLVTLTPAGADFVAALQRDHERLGADLFGDLSAAELSAFVGVLDRTVERVTSLMGDQP